MDTKDLKITATSLMAAIRGADLENAAAPTCERYWLAFELIACGSDSQSHARSFLVRICAMRLAADPANSRFQLTGTDWTDTEFTESQLAELAQIGEAIEDSELRARVCDVLWTRLRQPQFARAAAIAYLESADRIASGGHVDAGSRFRRGIDLALTVDKNGDLPDQLVREARQSLRNHSIADFVFADAIEHLMPTGVVDLRELMDECERRATATDFPLGQQRLFDLGFRLAMRLKDESDAARLLAGLAKSYEDEADAANMAVLKLRSLKMAIQTLRRGPGNSSERDRLHTKLLEAQEKLPSEFTPSSVGSVDLAENVENARSRLRGQDKISSIATLVLASQIHDADRWRENARQNIRDFPLQNIFAAEKFGSTYKTATSVPAVGTSEEVPEERLIYSMLTEYNILMGIVCHGSIQPMLETLNYAHYVTMVDVIWFVRQSPYIPLGRHEFFARGFLAGLQGQFVEALHVLVPQVEHMIRVLLSEKGVTVSGLDQNGHQREHDLNKLLDMPETVELLTDDIVTSLKLLFTHRAGPNLRNELSHGMLHAAQLYTPAAVYGWWLIIWLALYPVADAVLTEAAKGQTD